MPRKRKSNISQSSNKARAMKIARNNETSQQAELRRSEQVVREAAHRATETPEQSQDRRQQHAEYLASQRAAETPEQSPDRRQQQAEYLASQRAAETPELSQDRRQQHAEYLASQRAAETPEQSQDRRQQHAEYLASQRAAENPEESQARRQQHAEYLVSQRAAETPKQSQARHQQHAEYLISQRAAETPEQTQARRQQQAAYMASQRATETFEAAESRRLTVAERAAQRRQTFSRNTWGVFDKAAFEYDETLDYESHKLIKIEAMSKDCKFCGPLKWKEEAEGSNDYNLEDHLMIPIYSNDDNIIIENSPESRYNEIHEATYATIAKTIYKLKSRWRGLLACKELHYNHEMAGKIIKACCVLHNMCIMVGLEAPEMSESDIEEERKRQNNISDFCSECLEVEERDELVQRIEQNRLKSCGNTMETTEG